MSDEFEMQPGLSSIDSGSGWNLEGEYRLSGLSFLFQKESLACSPLLNTSVTSEAHILST